MVRFRSTMTWVAAMVLVVAACSDDTATTTTATDATAPTTASTTVSETTTSAPATLGGFGIFLDESLVGFFGADADTVLAEVTAVIGAPGVDSGWGEHPMIPDAEFRSITWGDGFTMYFGDDETAFALAGTRHFQGYEYAGSPPGVLVEFNGIGIGSTVEDLMTALGETAEFLALTSDPMTAAPVYEWATDARSFACVYVSSSGFDGVIERVAVGGLPCDWVPEPPFQASGAEIALTNWGMEIGDGFISLGDDPDGVVAVVAAALGAPTSDSGWGPHPLFDGAIYRVVVWGDAFILYFGDDPSDYGAAGVPHFQAYEYFGSPAGIADIEGLTVGNTAAELLATPIGPDIDLVFDAIANTPRWQFNPGGGESFLCYHVSDETAGAIIEGLTAGYPCSFGGE